MRLSRFSEVCFGNSCRISQLQRWLFVVTNVVQTVTYPNINDASYCNLLPLKRLAACETLSRCLCVLILRKTDTSTLRLVYKVIFDILVVIWRLNIVTSFQFRLYSRSLPYSDDVVAPSNDCNRVLYNAMTALVFQAGCFVFSVRNLLVWVQKGCWFCRRSLWWWATGSLLW